jgi:hypothetical protein
MDMMEGLRLQQNDDKIYGEKFRNYLNNYNYELWFLMSQPFSKLYFHWSTLSLLNAKFLFCSQDVM